MARDFKKIKAWQKADDLAVKIYEITHGFPRSELYGLTSQLRRAAVSVPANITEGASRNHIREYLQFLYLAKSSLAEVEYYTHLSKRLGYLENTAYQEVAEIQNETARVLRGLIKAVEKELAGIS